ncbi:MAG: hypothetical protein JRD89_18005 [Deltaproteobacteria bacterium]|nr:hypothetical protein [Deltaproteobacteria bacterium]
MVETPPPPPPTRFELGQVVVTRAVAARIKEDDEFRRFVGACLGRHADGDWGELDPEDKKANEEALRYGGRLFSAYEKWPLPKIWIITEADRSATTILFPEEY